jgi:hypothetical protein
MTGQAQAMELARIVDEIGLASVFADKEDLVRRLGAFSAAYANKAEGLPAAFPQRVGLEEILAEQQGNPGRVKLLLQAAAFHCSPEMLAMMWMVDTGADIAEVDVRFRTKKECQLNVTIHVGYSDNAVRFSSDQVWDLAVLRFVGITKADGEPLLEGFYPLRLK